jgi:DNA-binding winged helix-turn-helix (wHTH) protein
MTRTPSQIGSSSFKCSEISVAARPPRPLSSMVKGTRLLISRTATKYVVSRDERGATVARFGCIIVDFTGAEVYRDGVKVRLTAHEVKVLRYFIDNPGRVISRHEFLEKVWGYNAYPTTRTVDNQILKLRQKLERNAKSPSHFLTVHGVGYKFVHDEFESGAPATLERLQASLQRNAGRQRGCNRDDLLNIMLGCLPALYEFLARKYPQGSMRPGEAGAFLHGCSRANGNERSHRAEGPHLVNPTRSH